MFCRKCGSQMPDSSGFCPQCGTPVPSSSQWTGGQPNSPDSQWTGAQPAYPGSQGTNPQGFQQNTLPPDNYYQNPLPGTSKDKKKKLVGIAILAAAALVVLLLFCTVFRSCGSYSSPEATIEQLEKAFNDLNIKQMLDCFDSDVASSYSSVLNFDLKSILKATGSTIKVNLTVTDTDYYSSGSQSYCDAVVNYQISYSFLGYTDSSSDSETITLVKVKGRWLIDDGGMLDSLLEDLV